jgi:hypothetical protein
MSHTPGPWESGDTEWMISQRSGAGWGYRAILKGRQEVGLVWEDEDDAEMAANVRLVSAAPDLLDACEELLIYLGDWDDMDNETCAKARAAIAKAKGGQ